MIHVSLHHHNLLSGASGNRSWIVGHLLGVRSVPVGKFLLPDCNVNPKRNSQWRLLMLLSRLVAANCLRISCLFLLYCEVMFADNPNTQEPNGEETIADNLIDCPPWFGNMQYTFEKPQNKVDIEQPVPDFIPVGKGQPLAFAYRDIDING